MRARWAGLITALCLGGASCDARPPSHLPAGHPPSGSGGPIAAPTSAASPAPGSAPAALVDPGGSGPWFDPQSVPQLLDDPRLAPVAAALAAKGPGDAAKVLEATLRTVDLHPAELGEWSFQLGLLREEAGQAALAAIAYDRAADVKLPNGDYGVLRPYALHAAGRLLARGSQPKEALARFDLIPEGVPLPLEVDKADALVKLGEIDQAAVLYRAYLERPSRPRDWTDVALRFARALVQKPGPMYAEQAARLAIQIDISSSGGRGAGEAQAILAQAKALLPHETQRSLDQPAPAEQAQRALSLAQSGQSKRALAAADRLLQSATGAVAKKAHLADDVACVAHRARGDALDAVRRREESLTAYEEAIKRCDAHPDLPVVLYEAGRVAQRAGRPEAALEPFEAVETRFSTHRLADDARLMRADCQRSMGEGARAQALLMSMPTDFPDGDMVGDGLFQLALAHIELGDWRGAIEPLRRGLGLSRERVYYRAGRFPYFLGRALAETGDRAGAIDAWQSLVRDQPLTYYMALAYARLEELSPGAARRAVEEGTRAVPTGPHLVARSEAIASASFARALALSRQGAEALAVIELDGMGLRDSTAPPEVAYASAFLLASAGSIQRSHAIFRASTMPASAGQPVVDWLDHYPAGRWRPIWEIAFPRPYFDVVTAESARSGVPVALIYAIMREESAFSPRVVSSADAYGLMQLIVPTAKSMAKPLGLGADPESLKQPEINIALGSRFLSILRRRFDDNPFLAVPGYNAGPGAPERWLRERPSDTFDLWVERIPYRETRRYTKRVLTSLVAYEMLYGQGLEGEGFRLPRLASERAAKEAASKTASSAP